MCPMYALGIRMGKKALEVLGRPRENGVKLIAVVEYKNCLSDGLQYVCGTTYGKNNLYCLDYGKFAASFYDLANSRSVRISVKRDILEKVLEFGLKGQEVKKLPPSNREEEAREHFKSGAEIVEELNKLPDEKLFSFSEAPLFKPAEEPSLKHEICQRCGEVVLKDYVKVKNGKLLCIPCYSNFS